MTPDEIQAYVRTAEEAKARATNDDKTIDEWSDFVTVALADIPTLADAVIALAAEVERLRPKAPMKMAEVGWEPAMLPVDEIIRLATAQITRDLEAARAKVTQLETEAERLRRWKGQDVETFCDALDGFRSLLAAERLAAIFGFLAAIGHIDHALAGAGIKLAGEATSEISREQTLRLVSESFGDEQKARQWFKEPNSWLGFLSPNDFAYLKGESKLLEFVNAFFSENEDEASSFLVASKEEIDAALAQGNKDRKTFENNQVRSMPFSSSDLAARANNERITKLENEVKALTSLVCDLEKQLQQVARVAKRMEANTAKCR